VLSDQVNREDKKPQEKNASSFSCFCTRFQQN